MSSHKTTKVYDSAYRSTCPVTIGFNKHGNVRPIFCGKWSCPRCRKHNARLWAWRAYLGVEQADHQAWFWTLTMSGKIRSRKHAYLLLPKLWDSLRKAVQRFYGGTWMYIAFIEGQPKRQGMPHFHVISLRKAPTRLKDMAVKAGFGHQAKERPVVGKEAAFYVSKYTSKGDQDMPVKFRRCRTSRGWPKLPDYEGTAYLVPKRTESTLDFLLRVNSILSIPIETLHERWSEAWQDFAVDTS